MDSLPSIPAEAVNNLVWSFSYIPGGRGPMPADSDIAHAFDGLNPDKTRVAVDHNALCAKCGMSLGHPIHKGWSRHETLQVQLDGQSAKIREQKDEIARLHALRQEKPHITVIAPLTEVVIGPLSSRVTAVIESTVIGPNGAIWYNCAWWNGRERREAQVPYTEVGLTSPNYVRTVGFVDAQSSSPSNP